MTAPSDALLHLTGRFSDQTAKAHFSGHISAPNQDLMRLEFLTPQRLEVDPVRGWTLDVEVEPGTTVAAEDTGVEYFWNGEQWMQSPSSAAPAPAFGAQRVGELGAVVGGAVLLTAALFAVAMLFTPAPGRR